MATGKPTKLPLLSIPALWKYERSKSDSATASGAPGAPYGTSTAGNGTPVPRNRGFGLDWARIPPFAMLFLARQKVRYRRLKWKIAAAGVERRCQTPVGVGGANVCWTLLPHGRSRRSGSRVAGGINSNSGTPAGRRKRLSEGEGGGAEGGSIDRRDSGGDGESASPVVAEQEEAVVEPGVVGHVWVSLKLRDPSMLLMRVVRQWNMARDEASVQQRRVAQLEAKRWVGLGWVGSGWAGVGGGGVGRGGRGFEVGCGGVGEEVEWSGGGIDRTYEV